MPELAEVEFFRKQWLPGIGERVEAVQRHEGARIFREVPASRVAAALEGAVFRKAEAHGKQLCFRFSGTVWLGIHLGMAGKLLTAHAEMVAGRHEHLVLVTPKRALVFADYRMFGRVRLHQGVEPPEWWRNLPPQPHDAAFTRRYFQSLLERFPKRPLKALLLTQEAFPGIGNWMADEILWRARIHPATRPEQLGTRRASRLFLHTREVSRDALEVIGRNWGDPPETWLFPHRWKRSGRCPASGKPLRWETIGGRTTCFSPALQKKI